MPKGYVIAHLNVTNPDAFMAGYASKIQGVVEKSGGKFLVRGGNVSYAEGDKAGLNVIVEFPDVAAAHAWLESDAYKEITSARSDNSSGQFMIVEGV
jgi:uncharacterized protein (DUF1330 family)